MQRLRIQPSLLRNIPTEMGVNPQFVWSSGDYRITPWHELGAVSGWRGYFKILTVTEHFRGEKGFGERL